MVTDSHQHSARSVGGTRRGGQGRRMERPLHPIAAQLRKIAEEDAVRRERIREERQNSQRHSRVQLVNDDDEDSSGSTFRVGAAISDTENNHTKP